MRVRFLFVVAGAGLAACGRLASEVPGLVDRHRTMVFPLLASPIQGVARLTRGSLGEVVAGLLAVVAVIALLRTRGRCIGVLALFTGVAILAFYVFWGTAYRFPSLDGRLTRLSAPEETGAPVRLTETSEKAVRLINRLAAALDRGPAEPLQEMNEALREGFQRLPAVLEAADVHGVDFSPAKVSRVSFALSRLQLSGYYFPWTGEALINGEMPRSLWPRVAAHELAHQRGFARENEATVMGVLACLASRDKSVLYSGALGLFVSLDRDLAREEPEARGRLWGLLPPRVLDDLRAEAGFWKAHEGPAGAVSERINDAYLKAQGVPGGVASYSETTALFLLSARKAVVDLDSLAIEPPAKPPTPAEPGRGPGGLGAAPS